MTLQTSFLTPPLRGSLLWQGLAQLMLRCLRHTLCCALPRRALFPRLFPEVSNQGLCILLIRFPGETLLRMFPEAGQRRTRQSVALVWKGRDPETPAPGSLHPAPALL